MRERERKIVDRARFKRNIRSKVKEKSASLSLASVTMSLSQLCECVCVCVCVCVRACVRVCVHERVCQSKKCGTERECTRKAPIHSLDPTASFTSVAQNVLKMTVQYTHVLLLRAWANHHGDKCPFYFRVHRA